MTITRVKITEGHKRDFSVYLRWRRLSRGFLPWSAPAFDRGNSDTIAVWVDLESRGRTKGKPKHPRTLRAVLEGKKLLNWQIKQWAEGSRDVCVTIVSELREAYPWLPGWVWIALKNYSLKEMQK